MAQRLRLALQAIVQLQDYREQADASGFIPTWREGSIWTADAVVERTELAKLWATEPWLQEGAG
ncbi:MAG: hypothetical protein WDN25_30845 [Acetobacteraceae bacterium]